jgi:RNA recognition motif-containing protein
MALTVAFSIKNTFLHAEQTNKTQYRRTFSVPLSMHFQELKAEVEQKMQVRPSVVSVSTACTSLASSCFSVAESELESSTLGSAPAPEKRTQKFRNRKNLTTVMIRNIPCKYSQEYLLEEVSAVSDNFDFLYMPAARSNGGSKGYAFVNFCDEVTAATFVEEFQGHSFYRQPNSQKVAEVGYAEVQGLLKNIKFYKRCKAIKSKFPPFINETALELASKK